MGVITFLPPDFVGDPPTHEGVAATCMADRRAPHLTLASDYGVSEEYPIEWIRQTVERGFDVGRPRDDGK
jgi:hypothetical protein